MSGPAKVIVLPVSAYSVEDAGPDPDDWYCTCTEHGVIGQWRTG